MKHRTQAPREPLRRPRREFTLGPAGCPAPPRRRGPGRPAARRPPACEHAGEVRTFLVYEAQDECQAHYWADAVESPTTMRSRRVR